jgi:Ni,Fe-hydrogenase III small subunit/ferredoxin
MFERYKIWKHQGKQYIPDLTLPVLPETFAGRPVLSTVPCADGCEACKESCPTDAIHLNPFVLDLGKCMFCKECTRACDEHKITFTNDYKIATNDRTRLLIREGENAPIIFSEQRIRQEIPRLFGRSLKLRQVSAGGDGSAEWELGAISNPNFDFGRYGIDFVASPRHADGLVLTGPLTENMAAAFEKCYEAIPAPKLLILVGTDAISGGVFATSKAVKRSALNGYKVDLYVPGNPPHPLTFINGIIELLKRR